MRTNIRTPSSSRSLPACRVKPNNMSIRVIEQQFDDDTRLRILSLLSQQDELCAQDIMLQLDLNQSAASRHLRQLSAAGYITERRRDVAKCYSLNRERIGDTFRALDLFLKRP